MAYYLYHRRYIISPVCSHLVLITVEFIRSNKYDYQLSRHTPPENPISVHFLTPPIRIPYSSPFHVTPQKQTPKHFISCHPLSEDPIPVHFTSSPISRTYDSSLVDPIIIDYTVTPHQQILFQFISPHRS